MAILGHRFGLQYSNLDGTSHPDAQGGIDFVMGYNGRAVTGFQMRSSASGKGMGSDGDPPPLVLRKAIDKGMRPSGAGRHIDYLEIYEPDVLAADLQPVLRYGASLFEPTPPKVPRIPCGTQCQ
jgi:hypothetical protein